MYRLTKKTTILFPPELYKQLAEIAAVMHTSVAQLVRQSVIERYLLSDKKQRLKAVKDLSDIHSSVSDWQTMEKEIIEGKLNDII